MKKSWFHSILWFSFITGFIGLLLVLPAQPYVLAQVPGTGGTATPGGSTSFITNIFEGEPAINVRTGPSTIFYPTPCGQLAFGATAPALGSSPAHEWIEIQYKDCPNGVGWVYAPNVSLSPGYLPIVEPPPTATPVTTATIDPTLAAAFNVQPTVTRLPTFTPAPPLIIPTFTDQNQIVPAGFPIGGAIFVFALIGVIVLMVSFFSRR
jgi:hypothetical protein